MLMIESLFRPTSALAIWHLLVTELPSSFWFVVVVFVPFLEENQFRGWPAISAGEMSIWRGRQQGGYLCACDVCACVLQSLTKTMGDPCVQLQPNLSPTSNSCNVPAAAVSTAACISSWVCCSHGVLCPVSPESPGLAAAGSAERFCCVHGACKNEAAIYTSKCGNKGMTKGVSPLKHTLQHSRLLSGKKSDL